MKFRKKSAVSAVEADAESQKGVAVLEYVVKHWNMPPWSTLPDKFNRLVKQFLGEEGLEPIASVEKDENTEILFTATITDTEGFTCTYYYTARSQTNDGGSADMPATRRWVKKTADGYYEVEAQINSVGDRVLKAFRKSWGYVRAKDVETTLPVKLKKAAVSEGYNYREVQEGAGDIWFTSCRNGDLKRTDLTLEKIEEDPIIFAP